MRVDLLLLLLLQLWPQRRRLLRLVICSVAGEQLARDAVHLLGEPCAALRQLVGQQPLQLQRRRHGRVGPLLLALLLLLLDVGAQFECPRAAFIGHAEAVRLDRDRLLVHLLAAAALQLTHARRDCAVVRARLARQQIRKLLCRRILGLLRRFDCQVAALLQRVDHVAEELDLGLLGQLVARIELQVLLVEPLYNDALLLCLLASEVERLGGLEAEDGLLRLAARAAERLLQPLLLLALELPVLVELVRQRDDRIDAGLVQRVDELGGQRRPRDLQHVGQGLHAAVEDVRRHVPSLGAATPAAVVSTVDDLLGDNRRPHECDGVDDRRHGNRQHAPGRQLV